MSNEVAIRIENLGKRYRYGGAAPLSSNLRADVTEWARGLWPRRSQRSPISSQLGGPRSVVAAAIGQTDATERVPPFLKHALSNQESFKLVGAFVLTHLCTSALQTPVLMHLAT